MGFGTPFETMDHVHAWGLSGLVGVPKYVCIYHLVMTNIAMERSTIFKNGKPSISMGHLYHGYVK